MFAVEAYIKQNLEYPYYSTTKWAYSTNQVTNVDETKNTPVFILVLL